MPWLARDYEELILYPYKPKWDKREKMWIPATGAYCLQDMCPLLKRNFPKLKPGECVKVKLVRDDA